MMRSGKCQCNAGGMDGAALTNSRPWRVTINDKSPPSAPHKLYDAPCLGKAVIKREGSRLNLALGSREGSG